MCEDHISGKRYMQHFLFSLQCRHTGSKKKIILNSLNYYWTWASLQVGMLCSQ